MIGVEQERQRKAKGYKHNDKNKHNDKEARWDEGEGAGDVLCAGALRRVLSDVVRDLKSAIKS